ncbi:MAG TPA: hypothetical protein VFV08_16510 [Puia sp.]|nr:hypothetical protein [Puia sp.]
MIRIYLIAIVFFVACKSSPDFLHLNKGMKRTEVIKLVGAPVKRIPIGDDEWWEYDGVQSRFVILNNDTVKLVLSREEAASMMKRALDSANASKRSIGK